ncbi:MAG: diphosphomevalonate decarboxylase [Spirochaetales bacterium]|nr:diphosphomevalonate decarboxylase [Spirochaetales bacterium]
MSGDKAATAIAHPSLALVKYWGKRPGGVNIPATSSLAVSLDRLHTVTRTATADEDHMTLDGVPVADERPHLFFEAVRTWLATRNAPRPRGFSAESRNNFPTAAGLASSASGFAALSVSAVAAAGGPVEDLPALSRLARLGSGSAARSVFGGFTVWEAGSEAARQLYPADWWPDLRIVVLPLSAAEKPISSRKAMNITRDTSPYYRSWVDDSSVLYTAACEALSRRDLEALGTIVRRSYMRMFATMLSADEPVLYWLPSSIEVLHRLAELRRRGYGYWETMDAGPQVKVLATVDEVEHLCREMAPVCTAPPVVSGVGGGTRLIRETEPLPS